MSTRHLAIGLDGADLTLVEQLGPGSLPNLHRLMSQGAYAALQSVQPPATLPNWTTFLTGQNPGRHGVFDFTTRNDYRVRFTAGTVRAVPTVIGRLDSMGQACASLFFPATYPPEPLRHGVYVSGWDAPVAFEADPSFVWPRSLHRELQWRFGPMRFDDANEFDSERGDWHATLADNLCARIEHRVALSEWLLKRRPWQLFATYFGETDTASHHLWALHDPQSPRRPASLGEAADPGLRRVYECMDRAVGRLVAAAGPGVELTIASDHGFGGASDKVLYLNRALAEAGLLTFHPQRVGASAVGWAKETALTRLPPRTRERLFRSAGAVLPGLVESRARFGAIDMTQTQAFSDELNYFPAVHLNLAGRESAGTVRPEDAQGVVASVEQALLALRDPWSDAPVVKRIMRREALFDGPHVDRAPDLVLELHLDHGYSYNLMPSAHAPPGIGAFRRLAPSEYLGRKGRSLQGSHREQGLWIAAGPQVQAAGRVEAAMADATATLLARMQSPPAFDLDGQVCQAALKVPTAAPTNERATTRGQDPVTTTSPAPSPTRLSGSEQARVESRLRKLGYVD